MRRVELLVVVYAEDDVSDNDVVSGIIMEDCGGIVEDVTAVVSAVVQRVDQIEPSNDDGEYLATEIEPKFVTGGPS